MSLNRPKQTEMSLLVTPDMSNFGGKMHGGELMRRLDKVAYTCAMRYCGNYVVTLAVHNMLFLEPILIGEMLIFKANINYTGRSSIEVGIHVESEDIRSGLRRHTNSCYFTMVAVDENGVSVKIEPITPESKVERRRWNAALARKHELSASR